VNTVARRLGIVGLDQITQRFARSYFLHLAEKSLPLSALLGCCLLEITESELLATHLPKLACGYMGILA
jgi:hypothetical protein